MARETEDKFVVRMLLGLRDQLKQKPRITTARPTARSSTGWSAATSSKKNSLERTEWSTSSFAKNQRLQAELAAANTPQVAEA